MNTAEYGTRAARHDETRSGDFAGHDGLRLHQRSWSPSGAVRGAVVIVHGRNEHGGRYAGLAGELTAAGYAVHALDQRGNGRSDGPRGTVERFDDLVADLDTYVHAVHDAWPDRPLFLLGHSFGGLVALLEVATHRPPIDGLIVSAPSALAPSLGVIRRCAVHALSRLAPSRTVARIDLSNASRTPAVVEELRGDPLVHDGRVDARTARATLGAMRALGERIAEINVPILALHGMSDRITDPASSAFVHARVGSVDRKLLMYPGVWHELFHEPESGVVTADVLAWMNQRGA